MSLTSFLNDNLEARNYLSKTFAKPSIPNDLRLLVPSNSPRPGEIGAAFDYVFRFYLERLNPQAAAANRWVAVQAIRIVGGVDKRLAIKGSEAVRDAKKTIEIRDTEIADLKKPNIGDPLVRVTHSEIERNLFPFRLNTSAGFTASFSERK